MLYSLLHHQTLFIIILAIQFLLINGDHIYVKWLQNDTNIINNHTCILTYLNRTFHCSLGENGVTNNKVEGDGYSPEGMFPLREGYYRLDRLQSQNIIETFPAFLDLNIIHPHDGWCDDSLDANYNKYITLPYPNNNNNNHNINYNNNHNNNNKSKISNNHSTVSYENLWLVDSVAYDLFVVIGYNDDPIVPYLGSAIFFHITESYGATAGCIALNREDLIWLISNLDFNTHIIIEG